MEATVVSKESACNPGASMGNAFRDRHSRLRHEGRCVKRKLCVVPKRTCSEACRTIGLLPRAEESGRQSRFLHRELGSGSLFSFARFPILSKNVPIGRR